MYGPRQVTVAAVTQALHVPDSEDHKYTRATVAIATGSETYPGAGVLSVLGALKAGASLVRYASSPTPTRLVLARAPEVLLGTGKSAAVVVGSGMDTETEPTVRQAAEAAVAAGVPLIADAGAIKLSDQFGDHGRRLILTPHVGEAADLCLTLPEEYRPQSNAKAEAVAFIQEDPVGAAQLLTDLTGATVVLKGATTVVAQRRSETYAVEAPGGWAGTAGSGDVLAGVIGTVAAQIDNPGLAAAVGVKLHAVAAGLASGTCNALGETTGNVGGPITATDIARTLPQVVRAMLEAEA